MRHLKTDTPSQSSERVFPRSAFSGMLLSDDSQLSSTVATVSAPQKTLSSASVTTNTIASSEAVKAAVLFVNSGGLQGHP